MKTCKKCGAPRTERCKPCDSAYAKAYRQRCPEKVRASSVKYKAANRQKISEAMAIWRNANVEHRRAYEVAWRMSNFSKVKAAKLKYRLANLDRERILGRIYRKANRLKIFSRMKAWRAANLEKLAASKRAWYKKNPHATVVARHMYRARKRKSDGSFSRAEWCAIIRSQSSHCAICKAKTKLEADHIVPLSRGGCNYALNIQGLCKSCNSAKGAKLLGATISLFDKLSAV